jgi:hypothetical protein
MRVEELYTPRPPRRDWEDPEKGTLYAVWLGRGFPDMLISIAVRDFGDDLIAELEAIDPSWVRPRAPTDLMMFEEMRKCPAPLWTDVEAATDTESAFFRRQMETVQPQRLRDAVTKRMLDGWSGVGVVAEAKGSKCRFELSNPKPDRHPKHLEYVLSLLTLAGRTLSQPASQGALDKWRFLLERYR